MSFTSVEFKIFLQKSWIESWVFIDDIWRKFHNTNWYQLEDIIVLSVYIEHFQSVPKYFNVVVTSKNNFLIWYFRDSLGHFIHAQLDKKDHNLNDWQVIIERVVYAKAKVAGQTPYLYKKATHIALVIISH